MKSLELSVLERHFERLANKRAGGWWSQIRCDEDGSVTAFHGEVEMFRADWASAHDSRYLHLGFFDEGMVDWKTWAIRRSDPVAQVVPSELQMLEQNFKRMATKLMPSGWHSIRCNIDGSVYAHAGSITRTHYEWKGSNAVLVGFMSPELVDWTTWILLPPSTIVRKYQSAALPLADIIPHFIFMADRRMPDGWYAILADDNGDVWAHESEAWRSDSTWESEGAFHPVGSVPAEMIDWKTWKITPENRND